nr:PEP-CTERM sorting domain-containing protein [uncultured Desulfobacter sp.]
MNKLSIMLSVLIIILFFSNANVKADYLRSDEGYIVVNTELQISDDQFKDEFLWLNPGSHLYCSDNAEIYRIYGENSYIHFNGGFASYVETGESSQTTIADGSVELVSLQGQSVLELDGGEIDRLYLNGDSFAKYISGSVNFLYLADNASLYFYGSNLLIDLTKDDARSRWYLVYGQLDNGEAFSTTFEISSNIVFTGSVYLNDLPYQFNNDSADLAPVPEPSTLMLLGVGMIGLAGTRIRQSIK